MEKMVQFKSKGVIVGNLIIPDVPNPPVVVIAHGFTGYRNDYPAVYFAKQIAKQGVATLRFDFGGTEQSEGNFVDMTVSGEIDDLNAAIDFLKTQPVNKDGVGLVGHSMGGMVSILAGNPSIKALALWAPAVNLYENLKKEFGQKITEEIEQKGSSLLPKLSWGYGWQVGRNFWEEIKKLGDVSEKIKNINVPLLIVHGDRDSIVPLAGSEKLFQLANEPKELKIIQGSDHDFIDFEDELINTTIKFFKKYL